MGSNSRMEWLSLLAGPEPSPGTDTAGQYGHVQADQQPVGHGAEGQTAGKGPFSCLDGIDFRKKFENF